MRNTETVIRLIAISLLLFVSCSKEEQEDLLPVSKSIITGQCTTSSFTATLSGSFIDVDKLDIALGKSGVLYCEWAEDVELLFGAWLDGSDNPGCMISDKSTVSSESMQCTLEGLSPDTEYSYCLFLKKRDGTREIGAISTFKTQPFSPEFKDLSLKGIQCFVAFAEGGVDINEKDLACCDMGFIVSGQSNGNINNAIVYRKDELSAAANFKTRMNGLEPDKDYYCRLYVKYPISSDQFDYLYGPEKAFKTKNFEEVAIDLGLPSGTLWASYNLGAEKPEEYGGYFAWGEISSKTNFSWDNYKWKNDNSKYNTDTTSVYVTSKTVIDLEDDAANYNWGGDWRLPTIWDYDELWTECDLSKTNVNGVDGVLVTGVNGNSIFLPFGGVITQGTEAVLKGTYYYTYTSSLYFGASNGYYYSKFPFGDDPLQLKNGDWTHRFNRSSGFTIRAVYPIQ